MYKKIISAILLLLMFFLGCSDSVNAPEGSISSYTRDDINFQFSVAERTYVNMWVTSELPKKMTMARLINDVKEAGTYSVKCKPLPLGLYCVHIYFASIDETYSKFFWVTGDN